MFLPSYQITDLHTRHKRTLFCWELLLVSLSCPHSTPGLKITHVAWWTWSFVVGTPTKGIVWTSSSELSEVPSELSASATRFAIWRPFVRQDSSSVIHELESIFYKRGPPEEILSNNDTAFCSMEFRRFVDEWGIRLRHRCVYVPSGNSRAERCHWSVKRITTRKACTITEAVYRYNTTPKDAVTAASAPANAIHWYWVRIKGIDVPLPDWQETRGPYELGDTVWVKPPNSRCTTSFRRGQITGIVSEQAVLVDGTPCHVRDIQPAINRNLLASSGSGESSNDELLIQPMPRVPDDPTANSDADADSSDGTSESSDEEVQTIPLRRSVCNKRPCLLCHMCDLETRGGVWTWKWD